MFGALPAEAAAGVPPDGAASDKITYVALGDSYAAGVGGGDYLDACLTSPNGYAALLAEEPGIVHADLRGCAGASIDDLLATQLAGLDHRTKTITVTVGANDLGVTAVAQICLVATEAECLAALQAAIEQLPALAVELAAAYAAIDAVAPKATIYVTGYPQLIEQPVNAAQLALNEGAALLNDVIEATVTAAGPDFVFVDVESAFVGHRIGSSDPWIISPPELEAFHPNPAGYAAYAEAISAA